MQAFYKKALLALISLVLADALLAAIGIPLSYLSLSVLAPQPTGRWQFITNSDRNRGGTSTARIDDTSDGQLRFALHVRSENKFPYAAVEMVLTDAKGGLAQADWSKYSSVSFLAKCEPANTLQLSFLVFDDKISKPGNFMTYRMPQTLFACRKDGAPVSLDLTRLIIPEWWFWVQHLDLTHQGYQLNKVTKFSFGTSGASPRDMETQVEISELTLHGRDYRYIGALVALVLVGWGVFAVWFFRAHTRALIVSLDAQIRKDLPLVAYRQLTLEPFKDKEKATVLRFIATNYTEAHLDLESVVEATGVNRGKVNDLLKAELGLTFTGYVNKLRLTEASRLLTEKSGAAIAEIAYAVGYGNVSYFNKLFREEYGCTPKAFRSLSIQAVGVTAPAAPPEPDDDTDPSE